MCNSMLASRSCAKNCWEWYFSLDHLLETEQFFNTVHPFLVFCATALLESTALFLSLFLPFIFEYSSAQVSIIIPNAVSMYTFRQPNVNSTLIHSYILLPPLPFWSSQFSFVLLHILHCLLFPASVDRMDERKHTNKMGHSDACKSLQR